MKPFSREIAEEARRINLVEYLKFIGEPIVKEGKEYRLKKHDSLTINPETNKWCRNSTGKGGKSAVDYLMIVENMKYADAVTALVGKAKFIPQVITDVNVHSPPEENHANFALPKPADNNRRVFAYLHKERCILPQIINHFIKCGDLYEDEDHHNAVFVGRDEKGIPRFAHKRSTNTLIPKMKEDGTKNNNRWDVAGSDKHYGFKHVGISDRLFVFEAPIDMLSFISLRELMQPPGTWKKDSYISLDGVSDLALIQFVAEEKAGEKIEKMFFCLDNDEPGQKATQALCNDWGRLYKTRIKVPKTGKDFNDMLKAEFKQYDFMEVHNG